MAIAWMLKMLFIVENIVFNLSLNIILEERQIRLTAVPDLLMFSDWLLVIMCRKCKMCGPVIM